MLRELLAQSEVAPAAPTSRRATAYENEMRVADPVRQALGAACLAEWSELRCSKLPDVQAPLTSRVAPDTLYNLLGRGLRTGGLLDAEIVAQRHDVAA